MNGIGFLEAITAASNPDDWHELATASAVVTLADQALRRSSLRTEKANGPRSMAEQATNLGIARRASEILERVTAPEVDDPDTATVLAARLIALAVLLTDTGRSGCTIDILDFVASHWGSHRAVRRSY
jgi:hypothetical protein